MNRTISISFHDLSSYGWRCRVYLTVAICILIALLELGLYPVITNHLRFTPAIFP